jgi:hypothetical protein
VTTSNATRRKLPQDPSTLELENRYLSLSDRWEALTRQWIWGVPSAVDIPDVEAAIEISRPYHAAAGPMGLRKRVDP